MDILLLNSPESKERWIPVESDESIGKSSTSRRYLPGKKRDIKTAFFFKRRLTPFLKLTTLNGVFQKIIKLKKTPYSPF